MYLTMLFELILGIFAQLAFLQFSRADNDVVRVDVKLDGKYTIKSPNFPECCTKEDYLIEYVGEGTGYIRMVFDDIDIPSGSELKIYDGGNSSCKLISNQPHISRGPWSRPVIASSGKSIYINFNPSSKGKYRYVGFKATLWATQSNPTSWNTEKPFTDCPRARDPMDSGEIRLRVLDTAQSRDKITYRYDCVWQIKPPYGEDSLITYVKLLDANLDDGTATIHDDIYSEAPPLYTFRADDSASVKGLEAIESKKGLYLRAKKPLDSGEFRFIYGVYEKIDKSGNQLEKDKYKCEFKFRDRTIPGFRCQSDPWCLPIEHSCNKLKNCPDGSDESTQYCNTTTNLFVSVGRALDRDFECKEKKCPDGSCIPNDKECGEHFHDMVECPQDERLCVNGQCLKKNETCPGNCSHLEKKCDNGMCLSKHYEECYNCRSDERRCTVSQKCVKHYHRCPESKCHNFKTLWCPHSGECIYEDLRCDGKKHCIDGSDETNCGRKYKEMLNLLALLVLPAVILFLALTHRRKKLCGERPAKQENTPHDTGMRAPFVKKHRKNKQRTKSTSSTRSGSSQRSSQRAPSPRSPHRSPRASPGNSPHSETVPLVEVKVSPPPHLERGKDNPSSNDNSHNEAEDYDRTALNV